MRAGDVTVSKSFDIPTEIKEKRNLLYEPPVIVVTTNDRKRRSYTFSDYEITREKKGAHLRTRLLSRLNLRCPQLLFSYPNSISCVRNETVVPIYVASRDTEHVTAIPACKIAMKGRELQEGSQEIFTESR